MCKVCRNICLPLHYFVSSQFNFNQRGRGTQGPVRPTNQSLWKLHVLILTFTSEFQSVIQFFLALICVSTHHISIYVCFEILWTFLRNFLRELCELTYILILKRVKLNVLIQKQNVTCTRNLPHQSYSIDILFDGCSFDVSIIQIHLLAGVL